MPSIIKTHVVKNTYARARSGTINDRQKTIIAEASKIAIDAVNQAVTDLLAFRLAVATVRRSPDMLPAFRANNTIYLNLQHTGYLYENDKHNTLDFIESMVSALLMNFRYLRAAFAHKIELVELASRDKAAIVTDSTVGFIVGSVRTYGKRPNKDCLSLADKQKGRIHVRFPTEKAPGNHEKDMTAEYLALTIIHEATHKYLDTDDKLGYCSKSTFTLPDKGNATPQQVLKNADQLACFAMYFTTS